MTYSSFIPSIQGNKILPSHFIQEFKNVLRKLHKNGILMNQETVSRLFQVIIACLGTEFNISMQKVTTDREGFQDLYYALEFIDERPRNVVPNIPNDNLAKLV